MKDYYQLNSLWYLFEGDQKLGPFNLRKLITMYYEGRVCGTELWQSHDGKLNNFTDTILRNIRAA